MEFDLANTKLPSLTYHLRSTSLEGVSFLSPGRLYSNFYGKRQYRYIMN